MDMCRLINTLKKILFYYLMAIGLVINVSFFSVYIYDKAIIYKISQKIQTKVKLTLYPNALIQQKKDSVQQLNNDININFGRWQHLKASIFLDDGKVKVGDIVYDSLTEASKNLRDGQTMFIAEGQYLEPLIITANNVIISGQGHVVFDGVSAEGKAAIITKGKNITIKNIECKNIAVRDENGACIRSEGESLFVEHVYFHDSEQGILSGKTEFIHIKKSRFEKLGKNGRAHGIYIGSGKLIIEDSLFIAAVSEGHEIKSRARSTIIKNTIIASMSSNDSRLIDIPNGGELVIENSILQQGSNSVNSDAIGYGLEKITHENNRIKINNNIIILERTGHNRFLHIGKNKPEVNITKNIIISPNEINITGFNNILKDRSEANFKPYPYIPNP